VTAAISKLADAIGRKYNIDGCFYDVGPNVGALNRAVILDCDMFITPVAADLFSLRALSTVGRSISKWISDWRTIYSIAPTEAKQNLLRGRPVYIGYITSAFKVNSGRNAANPHAEWEKKIAPRVRDRVIKPLSALGAGFTMPTGTPNKIGSIKHFQSLAPHAQKLGLGIGDLRGSVNPGHNDQIKEAKSQFSAVAKEIAARVGI
jgi:hypothetical protein